MNAVNHFETLVKAVTGKLSLIFSYCCALVGWENHWDVRNGDFVWPVLYKLESVKSRTTLLKYLLFIFPSEGASDTQGTLPESLKKLLPVRQLVGDL